MRRRAAALVATGALITAGLPVLVSGPAAATQAPIAFTSAALSTYQTNGIAWAVASSAGKVFVGGTFTAVRPAGAASGVSETPRLNFVVLDAATGAPTSCAPAFDLPTDPASATVRALDVSPDGKTLYVGGAFSSAAGLNKQYLAALDIATCTIVPGFTPLPNAVVRAVRSTSTAVFYGGDISLVGGTARTYAAAATAVGQPGAGSLLPWAPVLDKPVRALGIKGDGSAVVISGDFDNVNGAASHSLAVLDPTAGATLHAFPGFIPPTSVTKTIAIDDTGFYLGNEGTGGGVFDGRTAVNWDYTQRWRDTCLGATQAVVVYKSVVYSGSHAHDCSSMGAFPDGARNHLLAQGVNDPTLLPWFPQTNDGLGESIGPRGLAVATTGSGDYLYVIGEFTTVNGVAQQGVTRFGQGVDTVAPSVPLLSLTSFRPGEVRVSWRPSLDTDDATLTYQLFRDGSSTPLSTTTATSWWWNRQQQTFVDPGLQYGSSHTYRVTVSDGTSTVTSVTRSVTVAGTGSPYATRVLADNPTMYLRYDEPADVFVSDSSPNRNNVTLQGVGSFQVTPAAVAGDPSKALTLTGTSSFLYGDTRFGSMSALTVETWFRTTTTVGGKLIGFGNRQSYPSTAYDKHVYMTNDGRLVFGVYNGTTSTLTSAKSYNDGAWHHVAATQNSGGMALYLDGVRVGHNAVTANQNFLGYWHVGGDSLSGSWPNRPTSAYFQGSLDETAVYATALSAATIAEHYTLGTGAAPVTSLPTDFYARTVNASDPQFSWRLGEASGSTAADSSGGGITATYGTGVTLGQPGGVSGTTDTSAALNGTTSGRLASSVSAPSLPVFSAEAWFKTTTVSGGKIIGFGNLAAGDSSNYDKHIYMRNDGRLVFGVYTNTTATLASANAYNDGLWHHVVGTEGPSGLAFYVDGALVGSNPAVTTNQNYSGYWRVGGDNINGWPNVPSSKYFNGSIDEVAVYTSALSASDVAAHYSAGNASAPDLAPPVGPTTVGGSFAAGNTTLTWSGAIDNVGVVGYQIHRSKTPGFTPSPSTLVATTAASTYTDTAVLAGVWYYRVLATDAAGNVATTSTPVGITVTDTTAPSMPGGLAAVPNALTVSLSWTASTDDSAVSDYAVYRSATSGFSPSSATLLTSVTGTSFVDTTPTVGTWYYRVVARDGAGNLSAPSSEASATQSDTLPPSMPTNVTSSVVGSSVQLSWTASTDDIGVAAYDIYRSSTSGFTPSGPPLASASGVTYTDTTAPEGTSYYRIVARDLAGNTSDASAQVTAVITPAPASVTLSPTADTFANAGAPAANYGTDATLASRGTVGAISFIRFVVPAAPAGKALSSAVLRYRTTTDANSGSLETHTIRVAPDTWAESTLTWATRPATGTTVLGTIAAGSAVNTAYTTSLDATAFGAAVGNQSVGGPVSVSVTNAGTDSLYFWSRNAATVANRPTLVLTYAPSDTTPPTQPTALVATAASPNVSLSWAASSDLFGISTYRVYRSSTTGFVPSPATLIGSTSATSYLDTTAGVGTSYYVVVAVDTSSNPSTPSAESSAVVADVVAPSVPAGLAAAINGTDVTVSWSASGDNVAVTAYDVYRGTSAGFVADGTTLIASVAGTSYTDPARPLATAFFYKVLARDAVGNASAPSSSLGVTVGDSTPPSQPAGLVAPVTGSTVSLSWTASSDDVGVSGYDVHRSQVNGFVPSVSTLLGTTVSTTFADSSVPNGTWYYRVIARDAAGNSSAASTQVSAVVSSAPTVVAINPVADTYANAGATATNYGTSSTLASRGSIGAISYLRFVLPAAPSGKTLTGATLTIRTTTDVNAGSLETHTVALASDVWVENTLTWANRPAITGPVIGTIASGSVPSTVYVTALNAAGLAALVGGQGTLSVTNTGTDSLYFWSANQPTVSYRPILTLTYS